MLSRHQLKKLLTYNPETGELRHRRNGKLGFQELTPRGLVGMVGGQRELAHRVIWRMMYSKLPDVIGHRNLNKSDNRLENLFASDTSTAKIGQKRKTNKSGVVGVHWRMPQRRWVACFKNQYLGSFVHKEDAIKARKTKEKEYFSSFSQKKC